MFIANVKKSVLGLIVGAAVVGFPVVVAAPAGADTERSPFGALNCNCQTPSPVGVQKDDINRGLRDGLTAWSGRPVSMHHNQSGAIN